MTADQIDGHSSCRPRVHDGEQYVLDRRNRQAEGAIADEVDRPYFKTGCNGADGKPAHLDLFLVGDAHSFGYAEDDIGSRAAEQHRHYGEQRIAHSRQSKTQRRTFLNERNRNHGKSLRIMEHHGKA